MKKIEIYQCEVCGLRYDSLDKVDARCKNGILAPEYPIGCVFGNHQPGAMYENITFAIASNKIHGHFNLGSLWACRDTGAGDSLGDSKCGGPCLRLKESDSCINPVAPHFLRMIKWLRDRQIEITVWDGKKPVSYATFIKMIKSGEWFHE